MKMAQLCLIALILASPFLLTAAPPSHSLSETQYFQQKTSTLQKALASKQAAPTPQGQSSDVMIISTEMRAKDFQKAFEYLRTRAPAAKIGVKLTNQSMIADIVKIDVMPGGTLIIFTTNTVKGLKYQIVKTEQIDSIAHV